MSSYIAELESRIDKLTSENHRLRGELAVIKQDKLVREYEGLEGRVAALEARYLPHVYPFYKYNPTNPYEPPGTEPYRPPYEVTCSYGHKKAPFQWPARFEEEL